MEQIRPYIGKNLIKILTGQRRVGKSFILKAIANEIREKEPDANIIEINLEDFDFAHIVDARTLNEEITSRLSDSQRNYVFLDEVQEIQDFEKVVRSLNLDPSNDIYITGSNSKMLSSEIASRLAGRSIEIRVHPLTYREFLDFHDLEDSENTVMSYLRYGGLPYLINLPDMSTWSEYVEGVRDAVVYRDVVTRHSIRNNDFLQRLMLYLADNVGQIFSAKRISDFLKSQKVGGSVNSIQTYVDYVSEAYIVNRVRRRDIMGKKYFEFGEKIFFEDLGIRNSITGFRPNDIGGILENVVYNHLISEGYAVNIGVLPQSREVDFVAQKAGECRYIQVSVNVSEESTAKREFGNLTDIPDNYEKILVTLRDSSPNTFNGIRMLSLREFLLAK